MDNNNYYLDLNPERQYSKIIEKTMEIRSKPLKKLEEAKNTIKKRISLLDELRNELSRLGIFSKRLYGLNSIFNNKQVVSTSDAISGTANKAADFQEQEVEVLEVASSHRIASKPLSNKNDNLPSGNFSLEVDGKKQDYQFSGGGVKNLRNTINNKKPLVIQADVIKKFGGKSILILGSKVEGKKSRIKLLNDSNNILKTAGFFEDAKPKQADKPPFSLNPTKGAGAQVDADKVTLKPQKQYYPQMKQALNLQDSNRLTFQFSMLGEDAASAPNANADNKVSPPQPTVAPNSVVLNVTETIALDELVLDSYLMTPYLNESDKDNVAKPPPPPKNPTDNIAKVLYRENNNSREKDIFLKDVGADGKVIIDIAMLSQRSGADVVVEGLQWVNGSLNKDYVFSLPELEKDKTAEQIQEENTKVSPVNEVDPAKNAKLKYKGVEVERDSNKVDDLIKGVTLNLKKPSKGKVSFTVALDNELILDSIINFIAQYNVCLELLNAGLNPNEPGDDIDEKLQKKYGLLKNEITFRLLKRNLRNILIQPYKTSQPSKLALLKQIGLAPLFLRGDPNNINIGKIEFDQKVYEQQFADNMEIIGELFGYDNDRDNIVDSGVGFEMNKIQTAYTGAGSILVVHKDLNNRRIKEADNKINSEKVAIDNYRDKLKREFAAIEQAQQKQKDFSSWLKNSIPSNNR